MTVNMIKETAPCSICDRDTAPTHSIILDPLCTSCAFNADAIASFLPIDTPHDLAFIIASDSSPIPHLDNRTCFCGAPITAQGAMRCWYHLYN